ncbi:MAG TPA: hypothetical protein VFV81_10505, partial [Verrucomicrobiae bacterium]|nr:hypothetical protein [Verrucomicrobiae bacterium]
MLPEAHDLKYREREANQQQRHAGDKHDDQRLLALDRTFAEELHDGSMLYFVGHGQQLGGNFQAGTIG